MNQWIHPAGVWGSCKDNGQYRFTYFVRTLCTYVWGGGGGGREKGVY